MQKKLRDPNWVREILTKGQTEQDRTGQRASENQSYIFSKTQGSTRQPLTG